MQLLAANAGSGDCARATGQDLRATRIPDRGSDADSGRDAGTRAIAACRQPVACGA